MTENLTRAAELITSADALVIAAGAGIGVDSGLPDFRGNEGFWKAYPALAKANLDFTQVASPQTFMDDPELAWGFYGHRLDLYRKTIPHGGFSILKKWSDRMALGARVFTSNVDGQFQKAGFTPEQMHECHGSIHHLQCMKPCKSGVWRADRFIPELDDANCRLLNAAPSCPVCNQMARPNILLFGDWNWLPGRADLQRNLEESWLDEIAVSKGKIVAVEVGTGTAIPTVRNFSQHISRNYGASIVRINLRESQVNKATDVGIAAGALQALLGIDAVLTEMEPHVRIHKAAVAIETHSTVTKVIFIDQARAEIQGPILDAAMISITEHDQVDARIQNGWKHLLRLRFDDIDLAHLRSLSQQELLSQYQAKFGIGIDQLAFTRKQAEELLAWIANIEGSVKTIVVHCRRGESYASGHPILTAVGLRG